MVGMLRAVAFSLSIVFAAPQGKGGDTAADVSVVSEKALKYHGPLRKRPEPGYLYDRFYNTWLDDATVADLQEFLAAKAAESKETPDLLLLAYFYAKQGDDSAALEEFRRALADNPGSAEAWYQKAAVEARTLDFETAISDLRKAREQKPDEKLSVLIDKQLGRLLVRNRQAEEAVKVWNELLAANPADEELAEDLVELHIDEGLFEQAAKLAEGLLERTKDPYLAVMRRLRLGDIHQRAGNREKALAAYGLALEDVGQNSWLEQEILAQTEQLFRREDNLSQLKEHYKKLFQSHAKRIGLHRRYAKLLVELAEADEAIAEYKKILELTPGDRANQEEYIDVLARLGRRDQAIEELQSLCEQNRKDAELHFRLATLLDEAEKKDESIEAIREYLAASDKSEYAYLRAARALERFEQKDAAAEVYREMAAAMPDSASAQEAYAGFLYGANKKDDAIAIYRKLAEGAPLHELLHVARALSAREEHEVALELLKARETEFSKEPLFFSQLAATAISMKMPELAVPWAQRRVKLAENTSELEAALDQAVMACDRADQIEPVAKQLATMPTRSVPQTCLLAELQEAAGDSDSADETLAKAAADGNLLAVSEQIRLFNQRRDWTAAAEATRKLLELPGGRKSIHVRRLVELLQRDFQIEEALNWIAEWKRLSPGSSTPWTTEAGLLRMEGKDDEAIAVMKSAVQKYEDDEDLRVRLAQLYAESNHLGDAERIYWQLYDDTEDVPGKLRWAQELAKVSEHQGKLAQLVENFEERRRSNRQSIVPLLALAEVHREADNYEGRRQALTAAAKIKPDDLELLHHIARVEEQEGDWKAAVKTLERAAQFDKTNRTKERIAKLHLNYGNSDDGFTILFDLAGAKDRDPRTLEAIADAMCGLAEWERAVEFLTPHVAEQSADYRLRYLLGVAQEDSGNMGEATAHFLQLLEDQEELPGVAKNNATMASMSSYFDMIRKMAPASVTECIELAQYQHTAYQHRQQRGGIRLTYSTAGGGVQTQIQMPQRVEMVRSMALTHLVTLAQNLDEEETKQLVRAMEQRGVKSAELLVKIGPQGSFNQSGGEFEQYLEEHPDDEAALGLFVLRRHFNSQPQMAKYAEKAVKKFRAAYPELAMLAAVQAGVAEANEQVVSGDATEEDAQAPAILQLDTALAIAEEIEAPSPMTVIMLAQAMGGEPYNTQEGPALPQSYRGKFSKLLVSWYPELRKSPQYSQWGFSYVVGTLTQGEDPTAFISFIDEEVSRHNGSARNRQLAQQMGYYQQQQQLLTPLSFPPNELTSVSPTVVMLLRIRQDNDPYSSVVIRAGNFEFDAEKAKPLIEKVRHPVLRLLLANRFELKEVADKTLADLLAAEQPQLDAYLLAAGKAFEDDKPVSALELLSKARYLPMDREMRARIDAAIVAAVTEAKDNQEITASEARKKEVVELGQAACLRLRQSRLDANKRGELIAAMEELGLKKEAEKLEQVAASQPASSGAVVYAAASPTRASQDRVAKLVADGKRDAAIKMLSAEVLGQARQAISNPQNASYMRNQFRELKQRVNALRMTEEVITSLEPGDSENPQRVSEYAIVCEMFDRKDVARKAYERLIAKRPKDDMIRLRLLMLLGPEEMDAAEEHLRKLNPSQSMTIGQMFIEQLQDYEMDPADRVARAELAVRFLKSLDGNEKAQTGWSNALVQMLSHPMHTRYGNGIPSLYLRKKADDKKLPEKQAEVQKRRLEVHRRLCEEMLKRPDSARAGFSNLLAAAEARSETLDAFPDLAVKILREEAERRPQMGNNPYANYRYYSSEPNVVRLQSPEEFLVRAAAAKDDWKLIEEDLLPALANGRNRDSAKTLEQMTKLYRCSAEDFISVAEEMAKPRPISRGMDDGEDLAITIAAWRDRKLKADMQPLFLERLGRMAKSQNHHQVPECVYEFVEATHELKGHAGTFELLEEVTAVYLGPAEKRRDFLAKHSSRNSILWGQPSGQIYVYNNFMSQLLQREGLLLPVLAYLQGADGLSGVNNLEHYARSGVAALAGKEPEDALDALKDSPWLADLAKFHPLTTGAGRGGDSSWLGQFMSNVASKSEDHKKNFAAAVAERYKAMPTFGLGLIDARLRGSDAVLTYTVERLDEIRKLDEQRQWAISDLVASWSAEELKKPEADKKYADLNAWLQRSDKSGAEQLLDKLRKAKRLEELTDQPWQSGEYLAGVLGDKASSDPALASEVFFRFLELAHDAQKRNQWNFYFGDGMSTATYFLQQLSQRLRADNLTRPTFVAAIIDNEKKVRVEYRGGGHFGIHETINQHLDRSLNAKDRKKLSLAEAVEKLRGELSEALGERSGLFVETYYNVFNQRFAGKEKLSELADALAQARKAQSDDRDSATAKDFSAALAMVQSNRVKQQKKGEQPIADRAKLQEEYRVYFAERLANAKLPIAWRMHLAAALAGYEADELPKSLGEEAIKVYLEAIDSGVAIPGDQQHRLLEWLGERVANGELTETASAWQEKWARRYLRPAVSNANRYEKLDEIGSSNVLGAALEVYLTLDDEQRVNVFLRRYDEQLKRDPQIVMLLLRNEDTDHAARFLRAHWTEVSLDWPERKGVAYDDEIAAQVPVLCEKLLREDERFFARALLAAMHDPKPNEENSGEADKKEPDDRELSGAPASTPRDERLLKLAEEFAAVEFQDDNIRTRTLALLARSPQAGQRLGEALREQYDKLNLAIALPQNDAQQWNIEAELARQHLANRFRQGDVETFVKLFDSLTAAVDDQNYESGQRLHPILLAANDAIVADTSGWAPEQFAAMGRSLRRVLEDKEYIWLNDFRTFNAMLAVTHARGNTVEELKDWKAKLSSNCRGNFQRQGVSDSLWRMAAASCGGPTAENLPKRLAAMEATMACLAESDWLNFHHEGPHHVSGFPEKESVYRHVIAAKLLSRDELLDYAKRVDPLPERHFMLHITLAEWLNRQKAYEPAGILFEAAAEQAPDSWKVRRIHWTLNAGIVWARAGNTERAEKLGKNAMAMDGVRDSERKKYERLTKLVEEGAGREAGSGNPEAKAATAPAAGDEPAPTSPQAWQSPLVRFWGRIS